MTFSTTVRGVRAPGSLKTTVLTLDRPCWGDCAGAPAGERALHRGALRRGHSGKQGPHGHDAPRTVGPPIPPSHPPTTSRETRPDNHSIAAVDACRWVTKSIPHAPYVTELDWITHFGCKYVVHGDDITSDSSGEDCYRFVKAAGRFKVVKRTPSISTTDLVGRMLLCTRGHFVRSLERVLEGSEGDGTPEEKGKLGVEMRERMRLYASDETGKKPGVDVYFWSPGEDAAGAGSFRKLFAGKGPRPGQRVVYVDGGFDLFSSGHIEFLRRVLAAEEELARGKGWYVESAVRDRIDVFGEDYAPAYVVAGVHNDEEINHFSGVNYPIMNIYERGLCVLQCRVSTGSPSSRAPPLPGKNNPTDERENSD